MGSWLGTSSSATPNNEQPPPATPNNEQPPPATPNNEQPPPSVPLCKFPECKKPVYVNKATGKTYDYCGITHAKEHKKQQAADKSTPPHMKCKTPGCNQARHRTPDGGGFYDYCSRSCSNKGHCVTELSFGGLTEEVHRRAHTSLRLLDDHLAADIIAKFQKQWVKCPPCPPVDHVFEIVSETLETKWNRYKEKLAENGSPTNVEEHYHGTTIKCNIAGSRSVCGHEDCGVCGISREGFQMRCIRKNIKFQRFGHGFYLAPNSSKCHDYTQGIHTHRAMLLCDVLPGNKHVVTDNQPDLRNPPDGSDSLYGVPGGIPGHSLNYPEIILFEEGAIMPRYIILYQKDGVGKLAK